MKGWLHSKTLWVNVFAIWVEVARRLLDLDAAPALDPVALAVINLILRKFTRVPVAGLL